VFLLVLWAISHVAHHAIQNASKLALGSCQSATASSFIANMSYLASGNLKNYGTLGWMTQYLSCSKNKQQFFIYLYYRPQKSTCCGEVSALAHYNHKVFCFLLHFHLFTEKNQVFQMNSSSSLILAFLQEICLFAKR
jgi:hypothetical protein